MTLRVLFDESVLEIFGNDGERVITERVYPTRPLDRLEIVPAGAQSTVRARLWTLKSVWPTR